MKHGILLSQWSWANEYAKKRTWSLQRDVIGLAETQRENSGEITIDVGQIITFYGKEKYHQHGVAFILRKYLNTSILNYTKVHNKVKD